MELKLIITRSFSRKINLGNYETMDLYSSRSLEIPAETPKDNQLEISQNLFDECEKEVMDIIESRQKNKDVKPL